MAKKTDETKEETAIVERPETGLATPMSVDDLMAPAAASAARLDEAGLGSEDVDSSKVVLPRVSLLQMMSKACSEELPGAKAGRWWVTPYNRPATVDGTLRFVPVRIYPTQRLWTPLDEGGGLVCEAADGTLTARDANGLAGATLKLDHDGTSVKSLSWEGGRPTTRCSECVYGPGAAAAAAGREPKKGGSGWLPKIVTTDDGKRVSIPDELRGPRCTESIDVLALIALPEFKDPESGVEMPAELIPAFITFAKTSMGAGKALAGMIKMAMREPAWARIYNLGSKKVQNDKGTFYIATVQVFGFSQRALMDQAHSLYEATHTQNYTADVSDGGEEFVGGRGDVIDADVSSGPPSDDDPEPGDQF